jgi:hypothetical protein
MQAEQNKYFSLQKPSLHTYSAPSYPACGAAVPIRFSNRAWIFWKGCHIQDFRNYLGLLPYNELFLP